MYKQKNLLSLLFCFHVPNYKPRLRNPERKAAVVKSYTAKAKIRIVHRAAASAWSQGVPWAEALKIATKALSTVDGSARKIHFSAKGKGKGKGKMKGAGKGKAWSQYFVFTLFLHLYASLRFTNSRFCSKFGSVIIKNISKFSETMRHSVDWILNSNRKPKI